MGRTEGTDAFSRALPRRDGAKTAVRWLRQFSMAVDTPARRAPSGRSRGRRRRRGPAPGTATPPSSARAARRGPRARVPSPPAASEPRRLHEPDVPRLALLVRLPTADGDERPSPVGHIVDVGPAKRAHLAPAHPRHEEEPGDHGVEAAALESDLVGLATAAARLVAGGEDGSEIRRPERSRRPPASTAGGPPVAGEDPGCPFPGRGRIVGDAGPEVTPRPPPSPRSPRPALVVELDEVGGQGRVLEERPPS